MTGQERKHYHTLKHAVDSAELTPLDPSMLRGAESRIQDELKSNDEQKEWIEIDQTSKFWRKVCTRFRVIRLIKTIENTHLIYDQNNDILIRYEFIGSSYNITDNDDLITVSHLKLSWEHFNY